MSDCNLILYQHCNVYLQTKGQILVKSVSGAIVTAVCWFSDVTQKHNCPLGYRKLQRTDTSLLVCTSV